MFQKKTEKQRKPKKLRVYTVNSRKPAVIVLWLMFICGFTFAVYKNFTAIDTHTVHEKEIVEWRVGYQRRRSVCAELCENVLFVER